MSPISNPPANDSEPGQLLSELERRQDDVLQQLDELESQLDQVLKGLGVAAIDETDQDVI